jgi:hypothetical protein
MVVSFQRRMGDEGGSPKLRFGILLLLYPSSLLLVPFILSEIFFFVTLKRFPCQVIII